MDLDSILFSPRRWSGAGGSRSRTSASWRAARISSGSTWPPRAFPGSRTRRCVANAPPAHPTRLLLLYPAISMLLIYSDVRICLWAQEKDKKFMIPLEGLKLRELESGFFNKKYKFAIVNPDSRSVLLAFAFIESLSFYAMAFSWLVDRIVHLVLKFPSRMCPFIY